MFSHKAKQAILVACVLALTTGCQTVVKEVEVIRTVEVFKPIAVPCDTETRDALPLTVTPDSIQQAPDVEILSRMYRHDHLLMKQRLDEQDAVLAACRNLPSLTVGQLVGSVQP